MKFTLQDLTAALVSTILALGCVVIAVLGDDIPAELTGPLGVAIGWIFTRSTQVAERTNGGTP